MVRERWYEMVASRGVVAIEDVGDDGPARRVRARTGDSARETRRIVLGERLTRLQQSGFVAAMVATTLIAI